MYKSASKKALSRRERAYVGTWGTTQMHLRNPFVVAFWSLAFGGLGHVLLAKYIRGFILVVNEIYFNVSSHLNVAIYYTLIGKFEMAKQVLEIKWLIPYIGLYGFAIWDSYREAVDINNNFVLAAREDAEVKPFVISSMGINYLNKVSPWVCTAWSIIVPGSGQIILHRMNRAFFLLFFWIISCYLSRVFPAIFYTMATQFDKAKTVLDIQWFLNLPSIYFFAMYDAYSGSVEQNKLFDWELTKFLKKDYQNTLFSLPFKKRNSGENMYIISLFQYTINLEKAITALQMEGIAKENILAVPLDKQAEGRLLFDRMHYSDGLSLLDLPMILGMVFSLFTCIYGFHLYWGPILWWVIGASFGFTLGLAIKLIATKYRNYKQNNDMEIGVVVIVSCDANQLNLVKGLLWSNSALGVSKLNLGNEAKLDVINTSNS